MKADTSYGCDKSAGFLFFTNIENQQGYPLYCTCATDRENALSSLAASAVNNNVYSCGTNTECFEQTVTTLGIPIEIIAVASDSSEVYSSPVSSYFSKTEETRCPITFSLVGMDGEPLPDNLASLASLNESSGIITIDQSLFGAGETYNVKVEAITVFGEAVYREVIITETQPCTANSVKLEKVG